MADHLDFLAARECAMGVADLEQELALARQHLAESLRVLHGTAPVRSVAKQVGLAAVTVSKLWRGHVCATPENIVRCIDAAMPEIPHSADAAREG